MCSVSQKLKLTCTFINTRSNYAIEIRCGKLFGNKKYLVCTFYSRYILFSQTSCNHSIIQCILIYKGLCCLHGSSTWLQFAHMEGKKHPLPTGAQCQKGECCRCIRCKHDCVPQKSPTLNCAEFNTGRYAIRTSANPSQRPSES